MHVGVCTCMGMRGYVYICVCACACACMYSILTKGAASRLSVQRSIMLLIVIAVVVSDLLSGASLEPGTAFDTRRVNGLVPVTAHTSGLAYQPGERMHAYRTQHNRTQ